MIASKTYLAIACGSGLLLEVAPLTAAVGAQGGIPPANEGLLPPDLE